MLHPIVYQQGILTSYPFLLLAFSQAAFGVQSPTFFSNQSAAIAEGLFRSVILVSPFPLSPLDTPAPGTRLGILLSSPLLSHSAQSAKRIMPGLLQTDVASRERLYAAIAAEVRVASLAHCLRPQFTWQQSCLQAHYHHLIPSLLHLFAVLLHAALRLFWRCGTQRFRRSCQWDRPRSPGVRVGQCFWRPPEPCRYSRVLGGAVLCSQRLSLN